METNHQTIKSKFIFLKYQVYYFTKLHKFILQTLLEVDFLRHTKSVMGMHFQLKTWNIIF